MGPTLADVPSHGFKTDIVEQEHFECPDKLRVIVPP
jgi:hypothetical protein